MVKVKCIEFDGTEHDIEIPVGLSLMEGANNAGVPGIDADCGGACSCATCQVYVDGAWMAEVGQLTPDETEMLELAIDVQENSRLSCQIAMKPSLDGLVVRIPESQH